MAVILPYQEDIIKNYSTLSNPRGEFLYLKDRDHEELANDYCTYLCLEISKRINEIKEKVLKKDRPLFFK